MARTILIALTGFSALVVILLPFLVVHTDARLYVPLQVILGLALLVALRFAAKGEA